MNAQDIYNFILWWVEESIRQFNAMMGGNTKESIRDQLDRQREAMHAKLGVRMI